MVSAGGHVAIIDLDALRQVQCMTNAASLRRLNRQLLGGKDWAPIDAKFSVVMNASKYMLFRKAEDSPVVQDRGETVPFERFEQTATGLPSASATWDAACFGRQCHRLRFFWAKDYKTAWFWARWWAKDTPESFSPLVNSTPPPEYDGDDR